MKNVNIKEWLDRILIMILFVSFLLIYLTIGSTDSLILIKWYLVLTLLGISVLPITNALFSKFHDNGYIFSKIIGLLFSSFLMWFLSSLKIMKFNTINSYFCVIIVALICFLLSFYKSKKGKQSKKFDNNKILSIIKIELLFLFVMSIACYIKGFNSKIIDTEKYMDYGYMAIMNKSDYMPPNDLWYAGKKLNYYYFGQYMSTFITKLSGVGVKYGYNLMIITLFSLTMFACYSIVYNLLHHHIKNDLKRKYIPIIGGIIAALANTVAGNMHFVIFGFLFPLLHIKTDSIYWFPDSTRYIENTIHEFPSYSFVLGDLHAHVINIIFVLLFIAILFAYLLNNGKRFENNHSNVINSSVIKEILSNPFLLFIGFLLGMFKMINYWDFPIYFVVSFFVMLFYNLIVYKRVRDIILITVIEMIFFFIISMLVSLPFTLSFTMISSSIKFVTSRSLLYKLMILWALPISVVLYFIYVTIKKCKFKKFKLENIMKYIYSLDISNMFIIILGICGIGLVLAPEILYVVDIYTGDAYRTNTMFKFTYQAYIMFGLCFGYILILLLSNKGSRYVGVKLTFLFVLTILYIQNAVNAWFGDVSNYKLYDTMDGTKFLDSYHIGVNGTVTSIDDYKLINWLNENALNNDVILETYGSSYTYSCRISSFTGLATPLGWITHEWLWRSKNSSLEFPSEIQDREDDIDKIYTSTDTKEVKKLINKYKIKYIIVGYSERDKYNNLINEELLGSFGKIVYSSNLNNLELPTYIIQVDR